MQMKFWPFNREQRKTDPSWNALADRGASSISGQFVDAKSAESISTVFGCVQALSESVACLPLHVYQRTQDERVRADDYPLARVLRQPNPNQSGLSFRESMTASVLLHGNAYARIESNGAGEITGLHPIDPKTVTIVELASGRYAYDVAGSTAVARLLDDEIFHLADRCDLGSIVGKSRITVARETLGLGLALRNHGSSTFANGAQPGGILTVDNGPKALTSEQQSDLRDAWNSRHSGSGNAGRVAVLSGNMKYQQVGMSLDDAQWVASQQFSVEEICRIFRVPPTMVGDLRHGSYSNTAELGSQFVRYSLARWIAMWEAEITRQLLGPLARRKYLAEHSVEGLLRGNPEARADFYAKAIASGWMTVDEVRRLENLPRIGNAQE
ncbi:phage portal protein [Xanthomonas perforans]